MLIIELNEFDPVFLKENAKELNLKNILYFFNLNHSETYTNEKKEHQGLDPWVQWVSIHTGKPFSQHKVKRLGQTSSQKEEQIWERIFKVSSLKWGVWGAMNAPLGDKEGIGFFLPDPWSFEEKAYPDSLNNFLSFPKYMSKNYLSTNKIQLIISGFKTLSFMLANSGRGIKRKIFSKLFKAFYLSGINVHSLNTILDYINCLYFIEFKEKYKTQFSIIFLNHIAHLQHHFWNKDQEISNQMKFGLFICDEILGELKNNICSKESIILLNGLKQKNVSKKGFFVYRQKEPINFIKIICPIACQVQQNMTNDATLIFKNSRDTLTAQKFLKEIKLKYKKCNLLFVERIEENKLFIQIEIEEKIGKNEKIILRRNIINFYDHIELVTERTGAHVPYGDIYYKNIYFPKKIKNHEFFHYVVKSFST